MSGRVIVGICKSGIKNWIYPANKIYTPFAALMDGDIEAIKERNHSYAKSYNHGEYTILATEERLGSEEAKHYFDVIAGLQRYKSK